MERKGEAPFEHIRTPEVARKTSNFLSAVEAATPESPVSLDNLAEGEIIVSGLLKERLIKSDELYRRHDELFLKNGEYVGLGQLDLDAILALSHDIIDNAKRPQKLHHATFLGCALLQVAEAGAQAARDPSLLLLDPKQDVIDELTVHSANLTRSAYDTAIADRIYGNVNKYPSIRLCYSGYLMDAHFAFWQIRQTAAKVNYGGDLTSEHSKGIEKLMSKFPAKTTLFDGHSFFGRPERHVSRQIEETAIKEFQASMFEKSPSIDLSPNIHDGMRFALEALDTAIRAGYSPDACLKIAVQNSALIGRLTERATNSLPETGAQMFHLEGAYEDPRLVIGFPGVDKIAPGGSNSQQLRRSQRGGNCPARYWILLNKGGEVHTNAQLFSTAIHERIGVQPQFLWEADGKIYVDAAALTVNYALYALAVNYQDS